MTVHGDAPGRFEDIVADRLVHAYGLSVAAVARIPFGAETDNFTARLSDGGGVFVKVYRTGQDLERQSVRVESARFARAQGVPTPAVVPDRAGQALSREREPVLSVWEFVAATPSTRPWTLRVAENLGLTLGRLHRAFAHHPAAPRLVPVRPLWWDRDIRSALDVADALLRRIGEPRTQADAARRDQVATRRADFEAHAPGLTAGLPRVVVQPVHYDFTRPNLLVHPDDTIAAVIDLHDRIAPPAWELGRVAFDPLTVATTDDWPTTALTLIAAYRSENPDLPTEQITACARMALLQAMQSFYGVREHYERPDPVHQADLDGYWHRRWQMTRRLLAALTDIEDALKASTR
ncbi:phosphotransferase [Embleya sp. NBC_00896]|uniref:phosphotransferase enzyme family protein n=1 Tax=Embleya sp. NBC_00896 TaxID=2975961 RepID=UPI002F9157F5|nr:phosphotransferase [Embleya sp. NBC_00896]